jgi:hypothetical protein
MRCSRVRLITLLSLTYSRSNAMSGQCKERLEGEEPLGGRDNKSTAKLFAKVIGEVERCRLRAERATSLFPFVVG